MTTRKTGGHRAQLTLLPVSTVWRRPGLPDLALINPHDQPVDEKGIPFKAGASHTTLSNLIALAEETVPLFLAIEDGDRSEKTIQALIEQYRVLRTEAKQTFAEIALLIQALEAEYELIS